MEVHQDCLGMHDYGRLLGFTLFLRASFNPPNTKPKPQTSEDSRVGENYCVPICYAVLMCEHEPGFKSVWDLRVKHMVYYIILHYIMKYYSIVF